MTTQPLSRLIREILAQLLSTGAPSVLDQQFSSAGFRLALTRKRVRGTDEILSQFVIRAPVSVTHYVYSSLVTCPELAESDHALIRDEIDTILFKYLNPLDVLRGSDRTLWLLSETEQNQMARVVALPPADEADFIFLTGPAAHWTGPIRGFHKTMATLAQLLSRHPDFATGKVICKPPASFLFFSESEGIERVTGAGIGIDGRNAPSRGIFALDTNSYMDALVQLGEDEARQLAAVEFLYAGSAIRAQSPLSIPLYRIPHAVPALDVRSITIVDGNKSVYEATSPAK